MLGGTERRASDAANMYLTVADDLVDDRDLRKAEQIMRLTSGSAAAAKLGSYDEQLSPLVAVETAFYGQDLFEDEQHASFLDIDKDYVDLEDKVLDVRGDMATIVAQREKVGLLESWWKNMELAEAGQGVVDVENFRIVLSIFVVLVFCWFLTQVLLSSFHEPIEASYSGLTQLLLKP